jgi:hypothetical protein
LLSAVDTLSGSLNGELTVAVSDPEQSKKKLPVNNLHTNGNHVVIIWWSTNNRSCSGKNHYDDTYDETLHDLSLQQ